MIRAQRWWLGKEVTLDGNTNSQEDMKIDRDGK